VRILLISQYPIPHGGGLSVHVSDLQASLREAGHDVELVEGKGLMPHKIHRALQRVICGGQNDRYRRFILEGIVGNIGQKIKARAKGFDLIHCHDPVASYAVQQAYAGGVGRRPLVETVHGPLTYESKMMLGVEIADSDYLRRLWEIESAAYGGADRIIAVDTGQARIVVEDFGQKRDKVSVIFNAVAVAKVMNLAASEPTAKVEGPYILVPRRLVQKTGVQVAIKALGEMGGSSGLKMVVAGDGPLRGDLEKLAADLGVAERVRFLGSVPREEVLRLAKRALAVVVPSIPASGVVEATSIAALEAMACGTSIIASNIGGLAEVIRNEETGFLVPPNDERALAGVLRKLYHETELRQQVARSGQDYVRAHLDTAIWLAKVLSVYDKTLKSGQGRDGSHG
jgi:glycosyltransferase involved in cell wall biosynthesis